MKEYVVLKIKCKKNLKMTEAFGLCDFHFTNIH